MRVGVPKEIKTHEYRVGLTPGAVREYVHAGHEVVVETGAGAGIGAATRSIARPAPRIADTAAEIFATADMIVKVKEPQPGEWAQLRPGQILFTYLHLAADPEQAKGLIASGCTAIAYETVTDAQRRPAAARADERGRRTPLDRGGGRRAAAPPRRPRPAARRRARRAACPCRRAGRRRRRHACRAHGRRASAPRSRCSTARCRGCASSTSCSRPGRARASRRSTPSSRKSSPPTS